MVLSKMSMKKLIIYYFLLFLVTNNYCLGQKTNIIHEVEKIEVSKGKFHSITLTSEGLSCKTIDENFVKSKDFFQTEEINKDLVAKIFTFVCLVSCCFQTEYLIIDDPGIVIRGTSDITVKIEEKNNVMIIRWIDGENTMIGILLDMINDLIPHDLREKYKILPNM